MVANYIGDASFAFTGSLAAGLAGMDLLGCNLVGFITALGGGSLVKRQLKYHGYDRWNWTPLSFNAGLLRSPETNIAPTNGWLEYYFPIGEAYLQVRTVSFREDTYFC